MRECHFTIGVYTADLLEKWDVLNLEHKSIIKHIIPSSQYTNMSERFPPRTEEQVNHVCTIQLLSTSELQAMSNSD